MVFFKLQGILQRGIEMSVISIYCLLKKLVNEATGLNLVSEWIIKIYLNFIKIVEILFLKKKLSFIAYLGEVLAIFEPS